MSRVLPILFNAEGVREILDGRKTVTRRVMKPQLPDACPECRHVHNEYIYDAIAENVYCARCGEPLYNGGLPYIAPYHPGDILYVRETWAKHPKMEKYYYRANSECDGHSTEWGCPEAYDRTANCDLCEWLDGYIKWHPSIHMPKEATRIWLKVTGIRVERLQNITEEQAKIEGMPDSLDYPVSKFYCPRCHGEGLIGGYNPESLGFEEKECHDCDTAVKRFKNLWNTTIKKNNLDRYGWDANPWVWVIEFERCEKP